MIISLVNQKGGVGKTTLATHLAVALARGRRLLMVDADIQGSTLTWAGNREDEAPFPIIGLTKPILHKELPKLAPEYDIVLVDGPGKLNDVTRSVIVASDIALIPVQPSPYDVWATREVVDVVNEVRPVKENLKTFFVINRKIQNSVIGRDVIDALAEYEIPALNTQIVQRVGYAETAGEGLTVLETDPRGEAAREIEALASEVMELINNG